MAVRPFRKFVASLLILMISALLYSVSFIEIPVVDQKSEAYFSSTLKSSTLAYASTRGVNAVVSVFKESEVDVSPAGLGLTIAAGQILDPIDDMTERLSDVIVMAIVSLGIQKIGFELGEAFTFKAVAVLILLFIPAIWMNMRAPTALLRLAIKACYILLVLRFLLPASSLVNEYLYENLLKERIETAVQKLSVVSSDYDNLSTLERQEERGFLSLLTGGAAEKIEKTRQVWKRVVENAEEVVTSLLTLTTLYVALFVIQVLLIPLGMLWLLMKVTQYSGLDTFTDNILAGFGSFCGPKQTGQTQDRELEISSSDKR